MFVGDVGVLWECCAGVVGGILKLFCSQSD